MVSCFEATLDLLSSANKLDREKGIVELERFLASESALQEENYRRWVQQTLLERLSAPYACWSNKLGCLLAMKSLATYQKCKNACDIEFYQQTAASATKCLTDSEPRVRMAAGTVLGVLCQVMGPQVYQDNKELVFSLIRNNLEHIVADDEWGDYSLRKDIYETAQRLDNLMAGPSMKKKIGDPPCFYDSVGWQNLETSIKTLQFMVEGCGSDFQAHINEELLALVFRTLSDSNHYVREAGFYLCSSLLQTQEDGELNGQLVYGRELSLHLAEGLADKWSQVRLAASVASRRLFMAIREDTKHLYYPQLLPRMCLNRYFAADGVRMYSQETWRQVAGSAGRDLVEQYIDHIIEYYKSATESENSAVREAACACIAELATKISNVTLRPFVDDILKVLYICFQDSSWPVRDAACIACGNLVVSYADEVGPALDTLYPLFYRNLGDAIASVRQGAATALCNVVRGFGQPALLRIVEFVKQGLKNMENQEATYKVDEDRSCKRMRRNIYALDGYPSWSKPANEEEEPDRPPQPWELADGCVYLIGELSSIKEAHEHVILLMPLLKNAARYKHYEKHAVFLETICKLLPLIARNLGKRVFSGHVEDFFDDIFYALENENRLTSSAASQCLNQLATFLGQNVLRAKVASYHPRHVAALESVIFVAPL